MRVYLDSCCYNRPFDDLGQDRVRLEAEAVLALFERAQQGAIEVIGSEALEMEISRTPDELKRKGALSFLGLTGEHLAFTDELLEMAKTLESEGLGAFDALHVASAILGNADCFLTVDDRLLRRAARTKAGRHLRFLNPVQMVLEGQEEAPQ